MKTVEDYINLKPVLADHRIAYGEHPEQFGELYLPKSNKKNPVIILLHGGCWQAQHSLDKLGQLSKALTQIGYAVWNLEFRRLGNGGGWPTTFEDVAKGADFLSSLAQKFSLDLTNTTAMGHSAGGHLALWLAGRHHLPKTSQLYLETPLKIRRVVSLAGIPDLVEGAKQNICRGACETLVGGSSDQFLERYKQASPHYLLPLNIPHWHLVGENDPIVPVSYLQPFIQNSMRQDKVEFRIIPKIGHFEMVMPDTASWNTIKEALQ